MWLDYIRRSLIESGELRRLIAEDGLRGVTSNPAIFEKAIAGSTDYEGELKTLAQRKAVIDRFMKAYRESIDWMYSSDPVALKTYADFVGIPVAMAKRTRDDFFPKAAVDPDKITGLDSIVQDAVALKYTVSQLTKDQLLDLIQIPPRKK